MATARLKHSTTARVTRGRRRKTAALGKSTPASIVKAIRKDAELLLLKGQTSAAVKKAQEIITKLVVDRKDYVATVGDKVLFLLSCILSVKQFAGYATLDSEHINRINKIIRDVERYIADKSKKARPLNFLMLAAPGAGKSHFIKCIATTLQSHKVEAVTFNMAGQRQEDLIPPLDEARNLKVQDTIPLLFLDEFDADESNTALLLPLLWDGELSLGQRDLKLGKVIIVLAGSHPSLQTTMNHARSMKLEVQIGEGRNPKLVDLLSRINGGIIEIPPFRDPSKKLDRSFDKVCVAVVLLRERFPNLKQVPIALLEFLALTDFRYGSRSIAHFVNMISYTESNKLRIEDIHLPISDPGKLKEDSLAYHLLHDDQSHGVVDTWKKVKANRSTLPVNASWLDSFQPDTFPADFLDFFLEGLVEELSKT